MGASEGGVSGDVPGRARPVVAAHAGRASLRRCAYLPAGALAILCAIVDGLP